MSLRSYEPISSRGYLNTVNCNEMAPFPTMLEKPLWSVPALQHHIYRLSVVMLALASCQESLATPVAERKPKAPTAGWVWSANPPKKLTPDAFKARGGSVVFNVDHQQAHQSELARSLPQHYREDHHSPYSSPETYSMDNVVGARPISGLNSHQNFYYTETAHGNVGPYPPFPPFEHHSGTAVGSTSSANDGCFCLKRDEVSCSYPAGPQHQDHCLSYEVLCCKEPRYDSDASHASISSGFQSLSSPHNTKPPASHGAGKQTSLNKAGLAIQEAYQSQIYGQNYNQYYQPATGPGLFQDLSPISVPLEPAFNPAITAGPGGYFPDGPQYYPSGNYPPSSNKYADYAKWFSTFVTGLFLGTQGANLVHSLAAKKQDLVEAAGDNGHYQNPYYGAGEQNGGAVFFKLPFSDSTFWKLWGLTKNSLPFGKKKFNKLQVRKSDGELSKDAEKRTFDTNGQVDSTHQIEDGSIIKANPG